MNSEHLSSFKLQQVVGARDVLAQTSTPAITRHSVDHAAQLFDVIARMIGMRVIGGPEEAVLGNDLGQRRDRTFVGIARDETLALEVVGRTFLELDGAAESGTPVDGVAAIEPL